MSQSLSLLVTGASGHLGSHVVEQLAARGHTVTGLDLAPPPGTVTACVRDFIIGSLAQPDIAARAVDDADGVVHCAALHPWKPYSDDQYLDANIKGTWHLYKAAAAAGVRNVVLTSSIAAAGMAGIPPAKWPVSEDDTVPIGDLYGLTKKTQEEIAKYFANSAKIRTIALRPPPFMPRPTLQTGFSLTACFAVVDDIAAAHCAAVDVLAGAYRPVHDLNAFEALNTTNQLPYTAKDAGLVDETGDMRALVRKYWPEAITWLEARGYTKAGPLIVYDLSKARQLLGWTPCHNFEDWFAEHCNDKNL